MRINSALLSRLGEEERKQAERLLEELSRQFRDNPLERFHCCVEPCGMPGCNLHPKQHDLMAATTPIQAAFAGNRFGKSTALTVKALVNLLGETDVPDRLKKYKTKHPPCFGRVVGPDLNAWLYGVILPSFRQWTPSGALLGGTWDGKGKQAGAWDKQRRILYFDNGSWVQFMTYEMDLDKFGGSALDFVFYDEPPPVDIRNECLMRLADRDGFELFAMTPLMGLGWIYRDIWKKREHPDITVVKGEIHDNPTLSEDAVERILANYSNEERQSREFGHFAHFGGMVYAGGFEKNIIDPPSPKSLPREHIVGIDPGMRNAAFVWVAFDQENTAFVYDELLLRDQTPVDYAKAIREINAKWGVDPLYVIDPSARNRSLVNAEAVQTELERQGIYCVHGQNQVEPGVQQVRRRLQQRGLYVSKDCYGLRNEAEEYRVEERADGVFKPVKENDHRLDALRYALMARPWYVTHEDDQPLIGAWKDGVAPPLEALTTSPGLWS